MPYYVGLVCIDVTNPVQASAVTATHIDLLILLAIQEYCASAPKTKFACELIVEEATVKAPAGRRGIAGRDMCPAATARRGSVALLPAVNVAPSDNFMLAA